jgi:hypothetical protein
MSTTSIIVITLVGVIGIVFLAGAIVTLHRAAPDLDRDEE